MNWGVHAERDYQPYYFLGGGRYEAEPFPPVVVRAYAQFDSNEAAASFEAAVRELLEKA